MQQVLPRSLTEYLIEIFFFYDENLFSNNDNINGRALILHSLYATGFCTISLVRGDLSGSAMIGFGAGEIGRSVMIACLHAIADRRDGHSDLWH